MDNSVHWLTDEIAVTGQISPQNISSIKKMGFNSIICNRPDYESDLQQPTQESIEIEANAYGIAFRYFPVDSNYHSEEEAQKMSYLMDTLPKPIFVFCRTGGRSSALIGLSIQLGFYKP
ncbi:MAG: hypothetical protein CBD16_07785 [Betaproteobacteria bacterium TMED156]|nr:MAG: hypothetical protein CBD16_07785 [Betaproteobacteria bacterium TMED156]|tara:strand:- start:1380 stop:1736 length:357 start_codon:yes stop_codon:yes gene_type:complete